METNRLRIVKGNRPVPSFNDIPSYPWDNVPLPKEVNMPIEDDTDFSPEVMSAEVGEPPEYVTNDAIMDNSEGICEEELTFPPIESEDENRNIFYKKGIESAEIAKLTEYFEGNGGKIEVVPSMGEEDNVNYFPDIMSGVAGDFAELYGRHFESPKQFFYMSFMTCLGSLLPLTLKTSTMIQPRIYTLLLGKSGASRKSTAIKQTAQLFRDAVESFGFSKGVNSAEGLQVVLGKHPRLLLSFDEFKLLVDKCKITGSVLLSCVNSLYEDNEYHSATKTQQMEIKDAHLSLLCASTIDTYEKIWEPQFTDIGFNTRLCIVPGDGTRKLSFPEEVPAIERSYLIRRINGLRDIVGDGLKIDMNPGAKKMFQEWYVGEGADCSPRADTIALRLMMLIAINDCKVVIDEDIARRGLEFISWQLSARKKHDPVSGDSPMAKLEEKIRRTVTIQPRTRRDIQQRTNASRDGVGLFDKALDNLVRNDEIVYDHKTKMFSKAIIEL